jgi:AcrR family transcriptional regulator
MKTSTASGTEHLRRRARETRARILEHAARVFAERGYEGTSFNDLIRTSGMTKGAFYFHFHSKEEVSRRWSFMEAMASQWMGRCPSKWVPLSIAAESP